MCNDMKEYKNYIFDLYGTLLDIHTDENSKELTLYAVWSDSEVDETTTIFNTNESGTVDDSVSGNSVSDGNAK